VTELPLAPPFRLRARLLSPLATGATRYEPDAVIEVDASGRLAAVRSWGEGMDAAGDGGRAVGGGPTPTPLVDLRPLVVMPGLVDLHAHLPQLPNAGLGAGLDLLTWLERYVFPLEHDFDEPTAQRLSPLAYRAFAAAGTTTAVLYGAVYEDSLEAAFRAAEAHGIRAILGKVMMDRVSYDEAHRPEERIDLSLRQSIALCERWDGRDDGRLRYAFTPRFAVSCSDELLRQSALAAASLGAYWQTHLAEDRREIAEVARLFPDAADYTDVYDQAGGLGSRAILAHAIHLSDRGLARLVETGSHVAHCPSSNLFLASGAMPLQRYLEVGLSVGLGSDVAGGPDVSLFTVMKAGAYTQSGRRVALGDSGPPLTPLDWLRLGTLAGAQALGLDGSIGSLEPGKEADLILVDPALTAPLPGRASGAPQAGARTAAGEAGSTSEDEGASLEAASDLMSRLIFRNHPQMVRGAWVRGRLLPA
jgi:guanine deaminase